MMENCNPATKVLHRPEAPMIMWAMIVSCLLMGLLLATIFKCSSTNSMNSGMSQGAMLGLLISLSFDLQFYSMTFMTKDDSMGMIWIDAAAGAVVWGLLDQL